MKAAAYDREAGSGFPPADDTAMALYAACDLAEEGKRIAR